MARRKQGISKPLHEDNLNLKIKDKKCDEPSEDEGMNLGSCKTTRSLPISQRMPQLTTNNAKNSDDITSRTSVSSECSLKRDKVMLSDKLKLCSKVEDICSTNDVCQKINEVELKKENINGKALLADTDEKMKCHISENFTIFEKPHIVKDVMKDFQSSILQIHIDEDEKASIEENLSYNKLNPGLKSSVTSAGFKTNNPYPSAAKNKSYNIICNKEGISFNNVPIHSSNGQSPSKVLSSDFQPYIAELAKKQKERCVSKIILVIDNKNISLEGKKLNGVKVIRSLKMNLDGVIPCLEKFNLLGKGSLIIVLCGLYSFVSSTVTDTCKEMGCPDPLMKYSVNETNSNALISKALDLHKYILNNTINDQVMFCDIIPINICNSVKQQCFNNHIFQSNIPSAIFTKYLKTIDEYNTFVKNHSQAMGYNMWYLLTNSFPPKDCIKCPLKLSYNYDKIDYKQESRYVLKKIDELIKNIKHSTEQSSTGLKSSNESNSKSTTDNLKSAKPITNHIQKEITERNDKIQAVSNTDKEDKVQAVSNTDKEDKIQAVSNTDKEDKIQAVSNTDKKDKIQAVSNIDKEDKIQAVSNTDKEDKVQAVSNTDKEDKIQAVSNIDKEDKPVICKLETQKTKVSLTNIVKHSKDNVEVVSFQSFAERLAINQNGRHPKRIVVITDYLQLQMKPCNDYVKVIKIPHLSFKNALPILRNQKILGKDSVIVLLCGLYSLVRGSITTTCRQMLCHNPSLQYKLLPEVTAELLINKALTLQNYILNETKNDTVMLCDILPFDIRSNTKVCIQKHISKTFDQEGNFAIFKKIIEKYNEYVSLHCQIFGFKDFQLYKTLFMTKTVNSLQSPSGDVTAPLADIVTKNLEKLLGDLVQNIQKQLQATEDNSVPLQIPTTDPSVSVSQTCKPHLPMNSQKEKNFDKKNSSAHSEVSEMQSDKDDDPLLKAKQDPKEALPTHTYNSLNSIIKAFQLKADNLAMQQKVRRPNHILIVTETQFGLNTYKFSDSVTVLTVSDFHFENALQSLKEQKALGLNSVIVLMFQPHSFVRRMCSSTMLMPADILFAKALTLQKHILNGTLNDQVLFCNINLSDKELRKQIYGSSTKLDILPGNIHKFRKATDEYNEFVKMHCLANIEMFSIFRKLFSQIDISLQFKFDYDIKDPQILFSSVFEHVRKIVENLKQLKEAKSLSSTPVQISEKNEDLYDHIVYIGCGQKQFHLLPVEEFNRISFITTTSLFAWKDIKTRLGEIKQVTSCENILFVILGSIRMLLSECTLLQCKETKCNEALSSFTSGYLASENLVTTSMSRIDSLIYQLKQCYFKKCDVVVFPVPSLCLEVTNKDHELVHKSIKRTGNPYLTMGENPRLSERAQKLKLSWEHKMISSLAHVGNKLHSLIPTLKSYCQNMSFVHWVEFDTVSTDVIREFQECKSVLANIITLAKPSIDKSVSPADNNIAEITDSKESFCEDFFDFSKVEIQSNIVPFKHAYIIGKEELSSLLNLKRSEHVEFIQFGQADLSDKKISTLVNKFGKIKNHSICFLVVDLLCLADQKNISPGCIKFKCEEQSPIMNLNIEDTDELTINSYIMNKIMEVMAFVNKLSDYLPVALLPLFPVRLYNDSGLIYMKHKHGHLINKSDSYVADGKRESWEKFKHFACSLWSNVLKSINNNYFIAEDLHNYITDKLECVTFEDNIKKYLSPCPGLMAWKHVLIAYLKILVADVNILKETSIYDDIDKSKVSIDIKHTLAAPDKDPCFVVVIWGLSPNDKEKIINCFKSITSIDDIQAGKDHYEVTIENYDYSDICCVVKSLKTSCRNMKACILEEREFFINFKSKRCEVDFQHKPQHCYYFHSREERRRIPMLLTTEDGRMYNYNPLPCPLSGTSLRECRDGERCTYSHNVYEVNFHPTHYKSALCPERTADKCNSGPWCHYSHEWTPEMFYTSKWEDLFIYGSEASLKYLVGAVRGLRKSTVDTKKKKILFICSSTEFLMIVTSVLWKLFGEDDVNFTLLHENQADYDNFDLFLGSISEFMDWNSSLLERSDLRAVIVDDVMPLAREYATVVPLISLFTKLRETNPGINKVLVAENYNPKHAKYISSLLNIPLKEINDQPFSESHGSKRPCPSSISASNKRSRSQTIE